MSISNVIEYRMLCTDLARQPEARDRYLCEQLGVTSHDLATIRSYSGIAAYLKAGEVVINRFQERSRLENINLSAQFTGMNLAALAYQEWENPTSKESLVSWWLKKTYRDQRDKARERTQLPVPDIHFFREEIGVYTGNLLEAKEQWQKLQVSSGDFQDSITIPLELDTETAFLLGVTFGDGIYQITPDRKCRSVMLTGKSNDYPFYQGLVTNLVHSSFNKRYPIHDQTVPGKDPQPRITLCSAAITSFLVDELGFPEEKEKYQIPEIAPKVKKAFFAGLMSAMANFYHIRAPFVNLSDEDSTFLSSVKALSQQLGFSPSECDNKRTTSTTLSFKKHDTLRLYREGFLRNPRQHEHPALVRLLLEG